MTITLNGTTGITTPDVTSDGLTVDSTTLVVDEVNNKVGICVSPPNRPLHVAGIVSFATPADDGAIVFVPNATVNSIISRDADVSSTGLPLAFQTGATERARIDSSGNLLLGSTTGGSDERLWVETTNADWCIQTNNTGSSIFYHIGFRANGTQTGRIQGDASTVSYLTTSDYRLKENIAPMTGALARVAQLNPVTYTWKSTGEASQGFIAHELQEVVPECVAGEKDALDKNGNPEYQGIDTSFLVATLTAAIQEQQAIIDEQKTALDVLTARVSALEASNV